MFAFPFPVLALMALVILKKLQLEALSPDERPPPPPMSTFQSKAAAADTQWTHLHVLLLLVCHFRNFLSSSIPKNISFHFTRGCRRDKASKAGVARRLSQHFALDDHHVKLRQGGKSGVKSSEHENGRSVAGSYMAILLGIVFQLF